MKRVRLTQRNRKAQSQADGLFPGDVGNMQRAKSYRKIDEYHTFQPTLNHWTPDMRHEWKEDKRDENNIPVPKVAELYAAAQNAIKLSMMFLGDNASQKMIQAQARDFMKLGNTRLVASMNRWFETEQDETVEQTEIETAEEEVVDEPVDEPADEPAVQAEEQIVEQPTVEAEEQIIEQPIVQQEQIGVQEQPVTEVADEQIFEDQEQIEIDENDGELNTEVDFDAINADEEVESDNELESIFEDDVVDACDDNKEVIARTATKKLGIKKIACQPKLTRVASKKVDSLESLWDKLDVPGIN